MLITLSGNLGSGKSTVCEILKHQYGYEVYSTGRIQRDLAKKMGMTTLELNVYMKDNPRFDIEIDNAVIEIGQARAKEKVVFDSRLAWHFIPNAFKVFLSADIDTSAHRIFNADRGNEESYTSLEHAKQDIGKRTNEERERFKGLYNVDLHNHENFDLVIDARHITPEQVVEQIMAGANKYYNNK